MAELYKCAEPDCPGFPYKASERRHPCPGALKRLERDKWVHERDVDTDGGPCAVEYYRCPECGSSLVDEKDGLYLFDHELVPQTRLLCDECSLLSGPI